MGADSAPILEVFASYQGEGLFVGEPETFLRLAGCPLRCRYCDTAHSWVVAPDAERLTPFGAMVRVAEVEAAVADARERGQVDGGQRLLVFDVKLPRAHQAGERQLSDSAVGRVAVERVVGTDQDCAPHAVVPNEVLQVDAVGDDEVVLEDVAIPANVGGGVAK